VRVFFVFAVAAALLIYSTGLWAPYYLDDPQIVKISETVAWGPRVLGFASFWLSRQLLLVVGSVLPWREPFYYRLANVFIHALAASALFWLVREITGRWLTASVAGALFLVHPVQTQAVTYISQRFESQAVMFMLCSAAAYARFRGTKSKGWIIGAILFAVAAGFTKETAVILPLWLLLIEAVFFEPERLRKFAFLIAALGVVISIPAWRAFQSGGRTTLGSIAWDRYFLTQGPVVAKYFGLMIWPLRQHLFYDFTPVNSVTGPVVLAWLLVLAIAGAGIYFLKRDRLAGFGVLSFFIFLLPVMLLPLPDLINEHRLYGAAAGAAIAVAAGVQALNRKSALVAVGILVAILAAKTAFRNAEWNDEIHFLEIDRAAFPHDPQILTRLASYYFQRGYVNKSVELNLEARRYEDRLSTYYRQMGHMLTAVNLSSAYLAKNNLQAAEVEARRAIAAEPDGAFAWRALGFVQLQEKEFRNAEESFRKYAELAPGVEAWQALRIAAGSAGDSETAKAAEEKLKIEEDRASAAEDARRGIPRRDKTYAIFALTLGALTAVAWAAWTVWSALRGKIYQDCRTGS
jgi:protein O-mannosyl-transferase